MPISVLAARGGAKTEARRPSKTPLRLENTDQAELIFVYTCARTDVRTRFLIPVEKQIGQLLLRGTGHPISFVYHR